MRSAAPLLLVGLLAVAVSCGEKAPPARDSDTSTAESRKAEKLRTVCVLLGAEINRMISWLDSSRSEVMMRESHPLAGDAGTPAANSTDPMRQLDLLGMRLRRAELQAAQLEHEAEVADRAFQSMIRRLEKLLSDDK